MDRPPVLKCRSCTSIQLRPIIDFGLTPLANRLLDKRDDKEPLYPLQLVRCAQCELVQITHTVPRHELFDHYVYFTSASIPMHQAARDLAARMIDERNLGPGSFVMEAASNDGYLLGHYAKAGIRVLGIEPAANVAAIALANGVPTVCAFFGSPWQQDPLPKCDIFHANNVLAHVADLNGFVAGIREVLKPDGIAVIECADVNRMFEETQFDQIYHEHLCYFSPTSLFHLFKRHELEISAIERITAHGGSLRVFVRHHAETRAFAANIADIKVTLQHMVHNQRVAGYGAAAKGTMLLNHCGIDSLEFICDSTPAKQGKFLPGMRTPIVHPSELARQQPDYCIILAWNYADYIMEQEREYRGQWIIPIPSVRCVDSEYRGRLKSFNRDRGDQVVHHSV